jgi:hypothetical protein
VPVFEQAWKGKGTLLDWVWFGGCTFSPAAVTWLHEDGGDHMGSPPLSFPVLPDALSHQDGGRGRLRVLRGIP